MTEAESRLEEIKSLVYTYMADEISLLTPYNLRMIYAMAEGRPCPASPVMTAEQRAAKR